MFDLELLKELLISVLSEFSAIVSDYGKGETMPAYEWPPSELLDFLSCDLGKRLCLDPFGEVVDSHQQIPHLTSAYGEGTSKSIPQNAHAMLNVCCVGSLVVHEGGF